VTINELESDLSRGQSIAHLQPELWDRANRHLVRKALAEFSHERILAPEITKDPEVMQDPADAEAAPALTAYRVLSDDGSTEYSFAARVLDLDHWSIDVASIRCTRNGTESAPDALSFISEFRNVLGIREEMLPVYLEEISSTLSSHAFKQWNGQAPAGQLAAGVTRGADPAADFQAIERSMTEGHPCFVANNGRLGFGITDYQAFAPESGAPVQLEWIAVHRSRAVFSSGEGLDYRSHLEAELGEAGLAYFEAAIRAQGLDPAQYYLMPVHPWQWENKITVTFAAEIARQHIVHVGTGTDTYQAQQSIRTCFNTDDPQKS